MGKDKRYVPIWKQNGWDFYDIGWVFWVLLVGSIVGCVILEAYPIDGDEQSFVYLIMSMLLLIGVLTAWTLCFTWFLVLRRYHLMISKSIDVLPIMITKELRRVLAESGVSVKDVTRPRSLLHEEQTVYGLEDGTTNLYISKPHIRVGDRSGPRTVVHMGPLGETNADLMESTRRAIDAISSRPDGESKSEWFESGIPTT